MVGPGRRFPFGLPRTDNANYLWIQLFHSALNAEGRAGFVMANSASDARASEQEILQKLTESRAVDVMVAVGPNRLRALKHLPEPLEMPHISHAGNWNEIIGKVGGAASSATVAHLTPDAPSSSLPLLSESCSIWRIRSDRRSITRRIKPDLDAA